MKPCRGCNPGSNPGQGVRAGSSAWIRALEKGFSEPFNPEEKASGRGFKDICLWKVPSGPSLEKMEEFNITEHNFVPKHIILDEKEVVELLKEYNISIRQLPRIFVTDPVAKVLNAKKGDVIKIVRKSPSAKEAIFYRVVVNA